jgi:MFS family permease
VLLPAAAGIVLFAAFVRRELRTDEPIFPPRLFANSIIRVGDAAIFVVGMLMFGAIVLVPVFLQLVTQVGAGSSGALLVPMLIGLALASTFSSQFMRRTGRYKGLVPAGLGLTGVGYVLLSTMTASTPPQLVAATLLVVGLGIGASVPTINVAVQNAADPRDLGVVISTVTFSRSLGGAFGAAIFWSLLLAFLTQGLSGSGLTAARSLLFQPERGALSVLGAGDHAALVSALAHAFHNVFLIGAALAAATLIVALRLREELLKTTRPSERVAST